MRKEVIRKIIDGIVQDFGNILVEELAENGESFPYTNACIDLL